MSRYRDSGSDGKVYVGDLGSSASKQELEDAFSYYGQLRNVWVARNPPGFAFVEFEDPRDADDAVRGLDGSEYAMKLVPMTEYTCPVFRTVGGRRIRVELSNGMGGRRRDRGPPPRRGRPYSSDDRCYECGERGHYARDCNRHRSTRRRTRSRSRSPRRRTRSRSLSRSRSRDKRSKSSDPRSRSRSRDRRTRSHDSGSPSDGSDRLNGVDND